MKNLISPLAAFVLLSVSLQAQAITCFGLLEGSIDSPQVNKTTASAKLKEAVSMMEAGYIERALELLEPLFEMRTASYQETYYLGYLYLQTRDYTKALNVALFAMATFPHTEEVYIAITNAYMKLFDFDNDPEHLRLALENITQHIQFNSESYIAYHNLALVANLLRQKYRLPFAYEGMHRIAQRNNEIKKASNALRKKIVILSDLGKFIKAEEAVFKYINLYGTTTFALAKLTSIYMYSKRFDDAIKSAQISINIHGNKIIIPYIQKIEALIRLKKLDEAIVFAQESRTLFPDQTNQLDALIGKATLLRSGIRW